MGECQFVTLPSIADLDDMRANKNVTVLGQEGLNVGYLAMNVTKKPFEITAGGEVYTAKSIIVATGAETKWLDAVGLSKLIGRGVSSCAPCDAPFFKNKNPHSKARTFL